MISLMEETASALASGDKDAIAELDEKSIALQERAKALGIDPKDLSTIPAELQTKMQEAGKQMMQDAMDKALEGIGNK